ncbi:hypothetical protein FOPE_04505 [Fonsecaea pedrosoi]|nr:hypothetical protein FOPE_04505 [Fonsecaea pedrosoi]
MVVAIVTGASRGIGRAIALQLADDGMDVAVNDIQAQAQELEAVKAEVEAKGGKNLSGGDATPGNVKIVLHCLLPNAHGNPAQAEDRSVFLPMSATNARSMRWCKRQPASWGN